MTGAGISEIQTSEARRVLDSQFIGGECDQLARDCALLRSCIWALSGGERPVHVLRVLNLALELCPQIVFDEHDSDKTDARARFRNILDELADTGDLVSLANGRWLPAPLHAVQLGTGDDVRLLIGGFPSSLVPESLRRLIQHHGTFRRVVGNQFERELELRLESFESWVGEVPEDLLAWTNSAMNSTYEGFREANDGSKFIFYAPTLARRGALQTKRWVSTPEKLAGRYLGRRELTFGIRQYRAVEVANGRVVSVALPRLGCGDIRRLMYGLDAAAGNPVQIRTEFTAKEFVVILHSEIPRAERRFFAALGTLSVPPGKYYPRTWRFPAQYTAEVTRRLSALKVEFDIKRGFGQ